MSRTEVIIDTVFAALCSASAGHLLATGNTFGGVLMLILALVWLGVLLLDTRATWWIPDFSIHLRTFNPRWGLSRYRPQTTIHAGLVNVCIYHR